MNPITKLVAYWKLLRAGLTLTKDPKRLDVVFDIADTLFEKMRPETEMMVRDVSVHEQARFAFVERPRVGAVSLPVLNAMPSGTLGRAFGEFLSARGLDPSALPQRKAWDDASYLHAHLYETHDLWHVVTGFETDVAGELGLQAFYAAQLSGKLPIALLTIGFLNTFLYAHADRRNRLDAIARGWQLGKQMKPLTGYRWAEAFLKPLEEVKAELGAVAEPRLALAAA